MCGCGWPYRHPLRPRRTMLDNQSYVTFSIEKVLSTVLAQAEPRAIRTRIAMHDSHPPHLARRPARRRRRRNRGGCVWVDEIADAQAPEDLLRQDPGR